MFNLPDLAYQYTDLEPYIDGQTMELHHKKHHQTYIDKLNKALEQAGSQNQDIVQILQNLDSLPEAVRTTVKNNGGGHYNHSFFWQVMAPANSEATKPGGQILEAINSTFGSIDKFQQDFADTAIGRFGSGWAWLIYEGGKLQIISTANQDSPIMEGVEPILGLDVWEHAYYLKYQNKRPDYINAWWNVVNWQKVDQNFAQANSNN